MAVGASGASQQDAGEQMSGDGSSLRSKQPPTPEAALQNTRAAGKTWAPVEFESENRAEGALHEYPRVAAHEYQSFSVKTRLYCLSAAEETGNH